MIRDWLFDRLGLTPVYNFVKKKSIPVHRYTFLYYIGSLIIFLLAIQFITGIVLMFYYKPTAQTAYESVSFIMKEVPVGNMLRNIHARSSDFLIAIAFVHLFCTFLLKSYRPPREFIWITGLLSFFIILGFGFSGYLLPWDELSFFATSVGTEIAGSIPVIGEVFHRFLRGGDFISDSTLSRFFAFHVVLLPICLLFLAAVHIALIQYHDVSVPLSEKERSRMPFVPDYSLRALRNMLILFAVVVLAAYLFPKELGKKADPLAPAPAGIKPEWYFLFMYETLKYIPSRVLFLEGKTFGVLISMAGVLFLFLVPFLDKASAKGKKSPLFTVAAISIIVYMLVMTGLSLAVK